MTARLEADARRRSWNFGYRAGYDAARAHAKAGPSITDTRKGRPCGNRRSDGRLGWLAVLALLSMTILLALAKPDGPSDGAEVGGVAPAKLAASWLCSPCPRF